MRTINDYLHQKASYNKIPLNGTFELSPVCNFRCKMCYVRRTPEQIRQAGKSLIPWQRWLELAQQCREAGTLYLLLTGGEPFLYPGFRELYQGLHGMGFVLAINSNGYLISEETVRWLKQAAPSRINITLYGASRETYGKICGDPEGYDRAMSAIRLLKEAGIPVVINASMIPENADDLERIMDIGKELGINTRVSTYMFPPVRREREASDSRFAPEESADMYMRKIRHFYTEERLRGILLEQREKVASASEQNEDWGAHEEFMRCRAGRCTFWISWEGKMTACGMMPFPAEVDPLNRSFAECWQELTEKTRCTTVLKGCTGCPKLPVCRPCAATVYSECGDVNGKPEYLCALAEEIIKKSEQCLEQMGEYK